MHCYGTLNDLQQSFGRLVGSNSQLFHKLDHELCELTEGTRNAGLWMQLDDVIVDGGDIYFQHSCPVEWTIHERKQALVGNIGSVIRRILVEPFLDIVFVFITVEQRIVLAYPAHFESCFLQHDDELTTVLYILGEYATEFLRDRLLSGLCLLFALHDNSKTSTVHHHSRLTALSSSLLVML